MNETTASIFPVILCGGAGTRLWPMSRQLLPKQFLRLASERSLLQDTVLRLKGQTGVAQPIVVCNEEHRFLVGEQLREIDTTCIDLLLEPVARNTAPAIAAAALAAMDRDPNGILFVLPSDHVIRKHDEFLACARHAALLAQSGRLVTFGVPPATAETGYGYIERGESIGGGLGYSVARFVEKPPAAKAAEYCSTGSHFWNSGMFVFGARQLLEELKAHCPDVLSAVQESWSSRTKDSDFTRLGREDLASCRSISIDYAVMERTRNAAMVLADIEWSDVGSWSSLWDISERDANGNATCGDVDVQDTKNSYVRAESRFLSVSGVENLIVVETADAVLVTHRDRSQSVKEIVSRLDDARRSEHVSHRRVYRPWGYYESVDAGSRFQVKRLMVKPGEALSLQLHRHRAEHWVVVSGKACVTRGEEVIRLEPNQSTYIPIGVKHRLENPGTENLFVVEIQSGDYLGEDDIVRFEDRYLRK